MKKNYCLLLGALFLCLSTINTYAQSIIRGPYLQSGTPNSMVIKWRTNSATSSQVWYGTSPGSLVFTKTVNGTRTDHEVLIDGLSANSTYYYSVGNTAGQLLTATSQHYFRTSPAPGAVQPIKAWILGDAGKANQNQRDVRDAFYNFHGSQHIDMVLLVGDNAYDSGTDGEYQAAMFENMYEDRLINTVWWPCFGNHDGESSFSATQTGPYYEIFTAPTNAEAGGVPSGTEAYYSFDYGNMHVVILDSDDSDRDPGSPQLLWLEADLAANNKEWTIVLFHHPPYTRLHSDTDNKESDMREFVNPILETYGVDLVIGGHSHTWERSYMIHGHYGTSGTWDPATMGIDIGDGRLDGDGPYMKNANGQGTVYIVAGAAGSRGEIDAEHPIMYKSIGEKGSMYLEVTGSQMDIKFIRETGAIDDYLTIVKESVNGAAPSVSVTAPANGTNYISPQTISITADAADSDGAVTQVEFFVNGTSIGTDNQAPYAMNYTIPAESTYSVMAMATDTDGNTTQSQAIQFTVGPVSICSRVDAGSDDAEERASGDVDTGSSDLELVEDGARGNQVLGLRFNNLNIPPGAAITEAYLRFTVDENTNQNPCSLTISGQASDNAATFGGGSTDISGRPRTNATVTWQPADWLTKGDSGPAQQTPDLASIIQEIVNRPGFNANSSIALIIEGVGRRTAESFESDPAGAPELCLEYSTSPASFDCPGLLANIGDLCDDGDNTTVNDLVGANCECAGTPTACTGIGDNDGDGICAGLDCDDNDASVTHQPGDACDDGNPGTINDIYDANCQCAGTLNPCTGIGDNDGDGICSDVDCNDDDPNSSPQPGTPCDDGDNTTLNDVYGSNCACAGTPTACTGIGDADGDGVCAGVDCDDNDPNNTSYPGAACNDGDPTTTGETIQSDCSCGGGVPVPAFTCVSIGDGNDDGEERGSGSVNLNSSDLELTEDGNQGAQVIGMRFAGLNIPQGAAITAAYLQFTADEDRNVNPCNLTIYGEAADDAMPFTTFNNNISGRMRTAASVGWSPAEWLTRGEAGPAQQTPDIAAIIQEIVNRQGFASGNSIVLLVEGTGGRTAESYNGSAASAPQLCVAFTTVQYDCPALSANIGDACDDGDNTTINDIVGANCACAGTPTACTGIGDADGDGVCADVDCDDNNASITSTSIGDADCDGVPTADDCDDNDASIGSSANDQDCDGVPTAMDCDDTDASIGSSANDQDCDGVPSNQDCDDNDPNVTSTNIGDADCDGVPSGMDCDDSDPNVTSTNAGDADCDGVPTADDCDDNNPNIGDNTNDQDCDGVPTSMDCDDNNAAIGDNSADMDCDGVLAGADCDDNDPNITSYIGQPCNDGDNTTINDALGTNCACAGTPTACTGTGDADGDGICSDVDCDDGDAAVTTQPGDPCDDGNSATFGETIQSDCSCGGGTTTPDTACSVVSASSDDAEERATDGRVDVNSSDLELCTDGLSQWVGLRFEGLNIPQGAHIVSAYLQFQVDESNNDDPCNLTIYGQAADNAATFTEADFDISSRPRTVSSVAWSPENWLAVGDAGPAQQSPDLSAVVQKIVDRNGYTAASAIAFILEGSGRRVAESADGNAGSPQLCVEYFDTPPNYDCPNLSAFFGDPCDDGDNTTLNDVVDGDCDCAGTPTACTGIGDADGDGICANVDCDDNDPTIATQPGDACDDGNPATINDMLDANCGCAGTLNDCPVAGDNDGDGICSDVDCDDSDPGNTFRFGDPCDDGDLNTIGETIQADCTCGGGFSTPTQVCAAITDASDDVEEEPGGPVDRNSSDLELVTDPSVGAQAIGMRFNGLNIPPGAVITSAHIQFTVDEAVNDNPCNINIYGQASGDAITFANADFDVSGRPRTNATVAWSPPDWLAVGYAGPEQQTPDLSAIVQEIVGLGDYTAASSIVIMMDGEGRRTAESVNGSITGAPELCVEYLYAPLANSQGEASAIAGRAQATEAGSGETPMAESHALSPIRIHPNPARNTLNISFSSAVTGRIQLQARDLSGKTVLKTWHEAEKGENTITLENLSLPGGIYFLQLQTESSAETAKFIIQPD
ncbi:MAG: metallophosphoesterase [Lewinellaceae bacterium]|nr:metallophosphoesterase [Lewinellaceae bacterium]